jgi:hypothetical protein
MGQTTFSGPVVSQNGFIENSFTTAQRDAIVNPTAGLLIYNTTTNTYQVYNGTAWVSAFVVPPSYPVFAYNRNASAGDLIFAVNPAGTKVVTIQGGGSTFNLQSYTLGTAWDVTSVTVGATFSAPFSVYNSYCPTLAFNADGTRIITIISDGGKYASYMTMSTPYDISTLSGTWVKNATGLTLASGINSQRSLTYANGGTKAYILDTGTSVIQQWNLASAYDMASFIGAPTATVNLKTLLSLGYFDSIASFTFSSDGLYAYIMDKSGSNEAIIYELSVGTAFDITSITAPELTTYNMVTLGAFDAGTINGGSIALDATGKKMLATGPTAKIAQLTAP